MTLNNIEKCFGTICDDEIEICLLTKQYVEGALEVLRKSFFLNESVCRATDIYLPESIEAKKELEEFGRCMIQDGISLVAKHKKTQKIIGVAVNTMLYVPEPGEESFLYYFSRTKCHTPNMKSVMTFLKKMDEILDIFQYWDIDCFFEIMFLSTLPDFGKMGIGKMLCLYSIKFAKELYQGIGIEYLNIKLKDKRPKAVSALFTSKFSQKIGENLGFEVLKEVPFSLFSYNEKTYAEKIGLLHPFCTISAIKF